jgi:hypothetical protein
MLFWQIKADEWMNVSESVLFSLADLNMKELLA